MQANLENLLLKKETDLGTMFDHLKSEISRENEIKQKSKAYNLESESTSLSK